MEFITAFESLIVLAPIITGYMAWNEMDKRAMRNKLSKTLSKNEVEHLIDLKKAPMELMQREKMRQIIEISKKLDQIEKILYELKKS